MTDVFKRKNGYLSSIIIMTLVMMIMSLSAYANERSSDPTHTIEFSGIERVLVALSMGDDEKISSTDQEPVVSTNPEIDKYLAKRPQQAFVRSLVLPGWGQRWGERGVRGTVFTAIETGIWGGLIYTWQSHVSRTGAYEAFAHEHAGITGEKSHQFYVDMGNYETVDEFNDYRRAVRDYDSQYSAESDRWNWDGSKNRETFKDLRIRADRDKNRTYYFVGALAINRILSAIDAARGLAREQKLVRKQYGLTVGYNQESQTPTIGLSYNFGSR